jgi:desulfoferrodoxin (superoxide reductase-like protein)
MIVSLSFPVLASPPKDIEIKIIGTKIYVKVYHRVVNPRQHYIKYIYVYVNGRWRVKQRFFYQQDSKFQQAVFNIPSLKRGDVVLVLAYCNLHGKLDKIAIAP